MASPIDRSQLDKAVTALIKHIANSNEGPQDLLETADYISLIIGLRKIPDKSKTKPVRVDIVHSLYTDDAEMCLFVKDPQKEFKAKFEQTPVKGLTKVIGLSKLRSNYKQYEAKRKLCSAFDLFLTDERVLPLLPMLLGKTFFQKKRQPVPVDLTKKDLVAEITKARDSTYLHMSQGPCCALRVAKTSFSKEEILANTLQAIDSAVDKIPRKWKNIQSIHIKTSDSIALPIYNALGGDGTVIRPVASE
eukprot:GILK01004221.1.p1 GENE.GILK01004221.1~~GILK01004221.1.p1  ORF type:complete len:264 (+),score=40.48 GILK01004221.1:50-793(+)